MENILLPEKAFGFSIDKTEADNRQDDLSWFIKKTKPITQMLSNKIQKVFFIYKEKEEAANAYEIARIRYKTISNVLEMDIKKVERR